MSFIDDLFKSNAKSRLSEEIIYAEVLREIEAGVRRDGLWARAIANANGNDGAARSEYIKLRVQSLKDEIGIYERSLLPLTKVGFTAGEASAILSARTNQTTSTEIPTKDTEIGSVFRCSNCTYEGKFLTHEETSDSANFVLLLGLGLIVYGLYEVFKTKPGALVFGLCVGGAVLLLGVTVKLISSRKQMCPVCGSIRN
jgi:hypothetical protein